MFAGCPHALSLQTILSMDLNTVLNVFSHPGELSRAFLSRRGDAARQRTGQGVRKHRKAGGTIARFANSDQGEEMALLWELRRGNCVRIRTG